MHPEHGSEVVRPEALHELSTEDAPLLIREGGESVVECGLHDVSVPLPKELESRIRLGPPDLREYGRSHRDFALGPMAAEEVDRHPADDDPDPALQRPAASISHHLGRRARPRDQHLHVRTLTKLSLGKAHGGGPPKPTIDIVVVGLLELCDRLWNAKTARESEVELGPTELGKLPMWRRAGSTQGADMLNERGRVEGKLRIGRRRIVDKRGQLRFERGPLNLVEGALRCCHERI